MGKRCLVGSLLLCWELEIAARTGYAHFPSISRPTRANRTHEAVEGWAERSGPDDVGLVGPAAIDPSYPNSRDEIASEHSETRAERTQDLRRTNPTIGFR